MLLHGLLVKTMQAYRKTRVDHIHNSGLGLKIRLIKKYLRVI